MNALTPRQQKVAKLLIEGLSNKEIARRLNCSVVTVKNHLSAIYKKYDVRNRLEFVVRARDSNG